MILAVRAVPNPDGPSFADGRGAVYGARYRYDPGSDSIRHNPGVMSNDRDPPHLAAIRERPMAGHPARCNAVFRGRRRYAFSRAWTQDGRTRRKTGCGRRNRMGVNPAGRTERPPAGVVCGNRASTCLAKSLLCAATSAHPGNFGENGQASRRRALRSGDGSNHRRRRFCVLQEPILGTADGEYWHRLGVRSFLPEIPQASMTKAR